MAKVISNLGVSGKSTCTVNGVVVKKTNFIFGGVTRRLGLDKNLQELGVLWMLRGYYIYN